MALLQLEYSLPFRNNFIQEPCPRKRCLMSSLTQPMTTDWSKPQNSWLSSSMTTWRAGSSGLVPRQLTEFLQIYVEVERTALDCFQVLSPWTLTSVVHGSHIWTCGRRGPKYYLFMRYTPASILYVLFNSKTNEVTYYSYPPHTRVRPFNARLVRSPNCV